MPNAQSSLFQELVAAGRGVLALLTGNRGAASYFDASRRGVAGSFIGLLVLVAILAVLPAAAGGLSQPGEITESVLSNALLCAVEIGFAAIVLRQLGRLDGLGLYIVASNWINVFGTLVALVLLAVGFPPSIAVVAIVIALLVLEINMGRLLLKLAPLQIAMLLIAQTVGISIGLAVIGLLLPGAPDPAALTQ